MYEVLKDILLEFFHAPKEPPEAPAGDHDSLQIFRASRHFLNYQLMFLFAGLLVSALVILIVGIVTTVYNPPIGLLVLFLLAILWLLACFAGYVSIRLEYDMRYYIITDRSLRIRKGVWTILEQTLTFVNIQNISIEQGPIQRAFGISTLVVETAGGGGMVTQEGQSITNYHRATLQGLEQAEAFRDLILNYLRQLPNYSGLGSPDDALGESGTSKSTRGFTQEEVQALKEILTEIKSLRSTT